MPRQLPIVRLPQQVGLLVMWALMMGLAFPRPNLWLLAYVALVPLTLVGVRGKPIGRVVGLTYAVALVWWLVMVAWVNPVTIPGHLTVSAYFAVYPVAFVLLMRLIHRRFAWLPFTFTVPLVWVGLEYVRGLVMTGFPWFLLGQSQPTWIIQIADLVGTYGVSFFVGLTNGLVADILTKPLVRPLSTNIPDVPPNSRNRWGARWGGPLRGPLFVWSFILAMTLAYGYYRTLETDILEQQAPSLRVAVVQTDVPQDNKASPTDEQDIANFREMLRLSEEAMQSDPPPDLIVWPETMVPRAINDEAVAFWESQGTFYADYRKLIEQFAAEHDVAMMVGAHAMTDWHTVERGDGRYWVAGDRYNAAYLIEPTGGITGRYDKLHRVPFGEYMPWVEHWPFLQGLVLKLTPHETDYSLRPGEAYTNFTIQPGERAWQIAAPICFEDVVSYVPRRMVWQDDRKAVDVLVNLTNDGWFAGTAEGPQHEQVARFRSVENRVPMARAVNRGVSGFIDSAGRIRGRVVVGGETQEVVGTATMDLKMDNRTTVFQRTGDLFAGLCLAGTIVLALIAVSGRLFRGSKMDSKRATTTTTAATVLACMMTLTFAAGPAGAGEVDWPRTGPADVLVGPEPLRLEDQNDAPNPNPRGRSNDEQRQRQGERAEQRPDNPLPRKSVEEIQAMDAPALEQFLIKMLVRASMSDHPALRSNAIEALQERPDRALPVTHRALGDENPGVRFAAAVTAGLLEFEDIAPALRPLLKDEHPAVRAAALSSLHKLGERVNLTPLADLLRSREPAMRGNMAMLLGLMGDKSAVPMLKLAAVEPMPRASAAEAAVARIQIAEAIAKLGDDSGLSSLRGGAYSQFDEVRVVAIIAMGAVGDRRMEVGFEKLLEDPPMEIQLAAAGSLARLGNVEGRSIATELAEHENPVIRAQAAWVLGWFEDVVTIGTLKTLLADESEQVRLTAAASLLRRQPAVATPRPEENTEQRNP